MKYCHISDIPFPSPHSLVVGWLVGMLIVFLIGTGVETVVRLAPIIGVTALMTSLG